MTDDFFSDEEYYRARARKEATARGLDPDTFERQLEVESGFNPKAYNKGGNARGIAQFQPATAARYGVTDPYDPDQAIPAAASHMADLSKKFGGDTRKALIGYYAGEGAVDKVLANPKGNPRSIAYPDKVLGQQAAGDDFFTADEVREIMGAPKPKPAQRPRRANVQSPIIRAQQTPAPGPFDYRTDPVAADLMGGKYSVPPEIEREARRDRDLQQQAKQRKREGYARKPLIERAAKQVEATVAGGLVPVAQGVENVSRWLGGGDAAHADTEHLKQIVAEQEASDPSTLGSIGRAIGSAAISAPVYVAPALATGGAAIPAVAGATALTEDWDNPKRAAADIATNVAGMGVGRLASPIIGKVAGRVGSDFGEKIVRALGEGIVGGGTNVAGTAATDRALTGEVNPDTLLKSAVVGAALSGVPELGRSRGGVRARATADSAEVPLPAPVSRELPAPDTQLRSPVMSDPAGFRPMTRPAGSKSAQFTAEGAYPRLELPDDPRFSSRPTRTTPAEVAKSRMRQMAEGVIPEDKLAELRARDLQPPESEDVSYRHGGFGAVLPTSEQWNKIKDDVLGTPDRSGKRPRTAGGVLLDLANLPRTVKASWDVSAPLRQGAVYTFGHPVRAARAGGKMFSALFSEGNFERIQDEEILRHPRFEQAMGAGLDLTGLGDETSPATAREENFSSRIATHIPGVRQSERAYNTYLDLMRMEAFDRYAGAMDAAGVTDDRGINIAAKVINHATGRGDLPGALQEMAPALNAIFFSPRFLASRLQLPVTAGRAMMANPALRNEVLKDAARMLGGAATLIGTVTATTGARLVTDREDPNFGKLKWRDHYYDLGAGWVQLVNYGKRYARAWEEGERERPGEVAERFARSKMAPVPGLLYDLQKSRGRELYGRKPATLANVARDLFAPMTLDDIYGEMKRDGLGNAVINNIAGVLGAGVRGTREREAEGDLPAGPLGDAMRRNRVRVPEVLRGFRDGQEEPRAVFEERRRRVSEWRDTYGSKLAQYPGFIAAPEEMKKRAITILLETTARESGEKKPELGKLNPAVILRSARQAERDAKKRAQDRLWPPSPGDSQ